MNGDPEDIRGWHRLDAATTTSGLLAEGDFARLAAIGVRTIINLALADSPGILPDEGARCAAVGIDYRHVAIPFAAPEDHHFAAFRAAITAAQAPVHVHCVMNWRVSACFYRLHREQGMAPAEARMLLNRHWDPLTSDHPDAAAWAAFMAR
ncbi:MAG: hypothetical protein KGM17_11145 [Sphingomonadales bacterium]|nr:hypothetical protein [Sphingomonadales bacterium]